MEIGVWGQTNERWMAEGAPPQPGMFIKGNSYFGLDGVDDACLNTVMPLPPFSDRVIEETDETVLFTDGLGRTRMALKTGTVGGTRMSMDHYIKHYVTDRKSWREMRQRYKGDPAARYPQDWDKVIARLKGVDTPRCLLSAYGDFGFYSMLRNWFGTEGLSYMFYDDPVLIHECLEFLCDHIIRLLERPFREMTFDFMWIHEDLAGKGGPLIGPKLFREFILPHYKRYLHFIKAHGVEVVLVDTDGDFEVLIPEFLEAGVDGFNPMEVASGMDPVGMRKKYGNSFCMVGGIDKREIAKGKKEIDQEVAKIAPLVHAGGYIPWIDHAIPPDISLTNFQYYLEQKRKVIFGE